MFGTWLDEKLQVTNGHWDVSASSHQDWFGQSVLHAHGTERLTEQAAGGGAGQRQLVQLGGGAAPEGPVDEGTPPFKRLLRKI